MSPCHWEEKPIEDTLYAVKIILHIYMYAVKISGNKVYLKDVVQCGKETIYALHIMLCLLHSWQLVNS